MSSFTSSYENASIPTHIMGRDSFLEEQTRTLLPPSPMDATTSEIRALRLENDYLKVENEDLKRHLDVWQQAENEWTAQRRIFNIVTENVSDLISILDRTGTRTWSNLSCSRTLGYTPAEMVQRPFLNDVHPDEQPAFMMAFAQVLDACKIERVEHRIHCKDNSWLQLESEISPVLFQDGTIDCVILISRNITTRKMEEERKLEEHALQSVAKISAEVAGEYQEFLDYVGANLAMAKNLNGSHNAVSVRLNEIDRALNRVRDVTERLVAMCPKLTSLDTESKLQPLEPLLRDGINLLLRGTPCRAEFIVPKDIPQIQISAQRINHAVRNIVKNAQQAMEKGGVIRVSLHLIEPAHFCNQVIPGLNPGHYIQVSFQDNGVGMSEFVLRRAIEPYFTTRQGFQGLGLTSTNNIMRDMGGSLVIESVEGIGTTASIYIPIESKAIVKPSQRLPLIPANGTSGRKPRALLMDDEEMIIDLVTRMLDSQGFEVVPCRDGAQAIAAFTKAKVTQQPFDVALLDLVIPEGVSGADAIHTLKKIAPNVPIVACSGYFDHPIMVNHKAHGFHGILLKPYQIDKLKSTLDEVLGVSR